MTRPETPSFVLTRTTSDQVSSHCSKIDSKYVNVNITVKIGEVYYNLQT